MTESNRAGTAPGRRIVTTPRAPAAIGTYSQAVAAGGMVFLSGQIPLDPVSMELVPGDVGAQTHRVFQNLAAVAEAAGGGLEDIVKLTVYLTDLGNFQAVNAVMQEIFVEPYPARAAVEVSALPRGAGVEVDAIMVLTSPG
ncbi:MAG: Rid family detoxifying hydrolase [Pseudomonadales bacterium]